MARAALVAALVFAAACRGEPDPLPDVSDAWSDADPYDVQESVRFTPEPYADLAGIDDFLGDFFPTTDIEFAPGDGYDANACGGRENGDLPAEIEGIVTLHPRYYLKISGCNRDEEKYYGNYFIEDSTGGIFIIGDSKVAHFDMGDRVKLRVRAVQTSFGLDMVYAHDVLEVHREARPVYYQMVDGGLKSADIGETRRVRGGVVTEPDTFGLFQVETEGGRRYGVQLDSELNRRRVHPPVGSTICATGPVMYSYSEYSIAILKIGQISTVDGDEECPD